MSGTKKPRSHLAAGRQAKYIILKKRKKLKHTTRKRRAITIEEIAIVIWRYHQRGVYSWKSKDVIWYLDVWCSEKNLTENAFDSRLRAIVDILDIIERERWFSSIQMSVSRIRESKRWNTLLSGAE